MSSSSSSSERPLPTPKTTPNERVLSPPNSVRRGGSGSGRALPQPPRKNSSPRKEDSSPQRLDPSNQAKIEVSEDTSSKIRPIPKPTPGTSRTIDQIPMASDYGIKPPTSPKPRKNSQTSSIQDSEQENINITSELSSQPDTSNTGTPKPSKPKPPVPTTKPNLQINKPPPPNKPLPPIKPPKPLLQSTPIPVTPKEVLPQEITTKEVPLKEIPQQASNTESIPAIEVSAPPITRTFSPPPISKAEYQRHSRRVKSEYNIQNIFSPEHDNHQKPKSNRSSIGKESFQEMVDRDALSEIFSSEFVDEEEMKKRSLSKAFSTKLFKKKSEKEKEPEKPEKQEKPEKVDKKERRSTVRKSTSKFSMKSFLGKGKTYEDRLADHLKELQQESQNSAAVALFSSLFTEVEKMDNWTSKEKPVLDWSQVEVQDVSTIEPEVYNLINTTKSKAEGFCFEFGRKNVIYSNKRITIEDTDKDITYYRDNLLKKNVVHHMSEGEEDPNIGAVYICFEEPSEDDEEKKAIIITKKEDKRFLVPSKYSVSVKEALRYIKQEFPELVNFKFTRIYDPEIGNKMAEFERQGIVDKYKFGILYVKEGQTDENDMFSNGNPNSPPSADFEEFLQFIGERITLKGWDKFRGGLDVKNDTTGTESVYCKHRGFEIMFHVSTLLPFQQDDIQRVERKRHLGNDIVVVIFKEGSTPFDPLCLTSHFNHIFVVVQSLKVKGQTFYKVAIANKTGVPPYGPFLHVPSVYQKSNKFKDFLLTKLINSERAAMYAPDFKGKMIRTRKMLLETHAKEFIANAKNYKPEKSSSFLGHETKSETSVESFTSTTTPETPKEIPEQQQSSN